MKCGHVAIIGRPNVGKSTLLNCILRRKLSITSRKPNTTRNAILGIRNLNNSQLVFVDTPGWQQQPRKLLNRSMNRAVRLTLKEVDCVLMVIDARGWQEEDNSIVSLIDNDAKVVLALNKEDLVKTKNNLLKEVEKISKCHNIFREYLFVSAKKRAGIDELCSRLVTLSPNRSFSYPLEMTTNRTEQFLITELVREKLIRFLGEELPYETKVSIENYQETNELIRIGCTIWVDRVGQKTIVVGKNGSSIKRIGIAARQDIEQLLGKKIYIDLWVKVQKGWRNDVNFLESIDLGK